MTEPDHIPQRIVDVALAALDQENVYSLGARERFARVVIAAVADEIKGDLGRLHDEHNRMRIGISRALYQIDSGPQMVSDRVEEHWSVVACRAADVLRTAASLPAAEDGE
jgi:hypothetical protein